jgi:hypothetical protein
LAMKHKELLENRQRKDRKIRVWIIFNYRGQSGES